MRLRVLGFLVLSLFLAIAVAPPPVRAQAPGYAELKALEKSAQKAFEAGQYAAALDAAEKWAAAAEKVETARGKPGSLTATALGATAYYALFAKKTERALAASERALKLAPDKLWIETNRAHALLFFGRTQEAIAAYTAHKGETIPNDGKWEDVILKDFAEFRKRGLIHPDMARVEKTLANAPLSARAKSAREFDAVNNRVIELYRAGKYNDAIPLAERYAAGMKARHGENSPKYATALNNLALLLQNTNRLAEAEPLMHRALAIHKKSLGPDNSAVAIDLNNLAQLFQATNRLAEAEPLMRRALTITEKSLGSNHSDVATALNSLAELLRATNRLAEAEPLYHRALAIDEKNLGPNHPDVAIRLNNLAQLLQATNRLAEAEPLMRRALTITEKSLGPDHPSVAIRLNNLAQLLRATNRLAEAEPLMRRALTITEKSLGPDHTYVAIALNNLAQLLQTTNRLAEAEPLMRRALAIDEKSLGPDHTSVARDLITLTALLWATNRLAEAEPLMRRALTITEKSLGPDHPSVATALNNLAQLLQATNRLTEAEPLYCRALAIREKSLGPDHPDVATALSSLAELLRATNRLAEAEPPMRRALAIDEKSLGLDHPNVAIRLSSLALFLQATNRLAEAEPLMRRALVVDEKSLGMDHPSVARDLNNLAGLLKATNRLTEAEPLMRRAISILEKVLGPDHPDVATALNNLAALLQAMNRLAEAEPLLRRVVDILEKSGGEKQPNYASALNNLAQLLHAVNRLGEAEPLYRRALAIDEKSFGLDHTSVARDLNNLALLLKATNRTTEAVPLLRRVISIFEKGFGPDHPDVATALNNLAWLREEQGDWAGAAELCLRAKPIMIGFGALRKPESSAVSRAILTQNAGGLRNCARVLYRANAMEKRSEGFTLAQWAMQNAAADALTSMSARFATSDSQPALLVRKEQDLRYARDGAYRALDAAAAKADAKAAEAARAVIAKIRAQLAATQTALRHDFPEYAALASPQPLSIAEVQAFLSEDQALVLFLDMPQFGKVPEETLIFALTRKAARWLSIPLGTETLRARVTALRCGLDGSNWRQGQASRDICKSLLNIEVAEDEQPPFDAAIAHALYHDMFGGIEDLTRGKSLLIVPSGPLTQLPFEVLVTAEPDKKLPRFEAYKKAAWLGQHHAVTVLPTVGSLKALHTAKSSEATVPFIGFGNPLLTGVDGTDKRAWAKQTCRDATQPKQTRIASFLSNFLSMFRGGAVDIEKLRKAPPLPETADELCAVAAGLSVSGAKLDNAVYLGKRATVLQVEALSKSGALARARVVEFATHGLLAGETAMFAQNHAEPSLLLTPPDKANDDDDGLLTASEVAQLKLNADWVILSACNTAAGEGDGANAEALSGLARAFFYAGARSLLVSHWPVNSEAAVELTTGTIQEMKANPKIGRAEALRRSISALIAKGNGWDHPSLWAPFVLVGNGGP